MRLKNVKGAQSAVEQSPFCFHEPIEMKGHWKDYLLDGSPLHIEVGMGKGKFLMELAAQNPSVSYIGVEQYSSVLYRAIQKMEEQPLANVRFICMQAELLPDVFDEKSVEKIYLNFSDPWPKERHAKRRLTSRQFLERYDKILAPGGVIEFKTDNEALFDFSLEEIPAAGWRILACTRDLHHDAALNEGNIMTEYEEKFSGQGKAICKMVFGR